MKVAIIGAGIVGSTAAYYLSKEAQVDVTVYDHGVGQATKAAAGIISPWFSKRRKTLVVGRRNAKNDEKRPSSVDEMQDLLKIIRHPWMKAKKRQKNARHPWMKVRKHLKSAFGHGRRVENSI